MDFFAKAKTYDIFSPADVEREPITQEIIEQFEKQKPQPVFVDAMTQFRYLARSSRSSNGSHSVPTVHRQTTLE